MRLQVVWISKQVPPVILNHYFGADLPLLEDTSFFSTWERPYEFMDVSDRIINDGEKYNHKYE